jgi:hypothetical protein
MDMYVQELMLARILASHSHAYVQALACIGIPIRCSASCNSGLLWSFQQQVLGS